MKSLILRFKLFGFYACMAVCSLILPREGKLMIELAEEADRERARKKHVDAAMGNAQRSNASYGMGREG